MAKSKGFDNNIPWKKFNKIKDGSPTGLLLIFILQMLQQAASLAARRYPNTAASLLELADETSTITKAYKAEQKIKHNHKVILQKKFDEKFATVSALIYFGSLALLLA